MKCGYVGMTLHKITAGDGYTYLTRQVAAMDSTERGVGSLNEYYSAKGETPGTWWGNGLTALGIDAGSAVSEAQMKALFGEGRHPDADTIEAAAITEGHTVPAALSMTRLGSPYRIFEGTSEWRRRLAVAYAEHNVPARTAIPDADRARIRTDLAGEMFREAFGRDPLADRELSGFLAQLSRPGTTAVAGFDCTFEPVKSVSVMWAIAPPAIRAELAAAHNAAVDAALEWMQAEVAYTRLGDGGPAQVETRGLLVTRFAHRDSRNGDPHLHTHCAVSNKVQLASASDPLDGWRALDGRLIHQLKVSAGEVYNSAIEHELTDRLGATCAPVESRSGRRPIREIDGVDLSLKDRFSTRNAEIIERRQHLAVQFAHQHGRQPSPLELIELGAQAHLETRVAKHEPRAAADQHAQWQAEAGQHLGLDAEQAGPDQVSRAGLRLHPVPGEPAAMTPDLIAELADRAVAAVAADRSVWQRHHLFSEAQRLARAVTVPAADRAAFVEAIVNDAVQRVSAAIGVLPEDPDTVPEPLRRSRDGQSVFTRVGGQLYTSDTMLQAEQRILDAAALADGWRCQQADLELALLEWQANNPGRDLNTGQRLLVTDLACSGRRVQLANAPAGTGKTTALRVLATAHRNSGGTLLALAPQASAAQQLVKALGGSPADTLDKLVYEITHRPAAAWPQWVKQIDAKTLILIDEASLASTANLDTAIGFALERGASVRLIGDTSQLSAAAASGVLRDLDALHGSLTLTEVMRFTDKTEGAASLALRARNPGALGYYLDRGRIHAATADTVTDAVFARARADLDTGADVLVIAESLNMVADLNARFRAHRLDTTSGVRGRETVVSGGETVSAGDTIIAKKNDRRLPLGRSNHVKNNDRFTVLRVQNNSDLIVRDLDTARVVRLPADYTRRHVRLGYAATLRSEQGDTIGGDTTPTGPRAGIVHAIFSPSATAADLYVGLSRATTENHAWAVLPGDGDAHTVLRPDHLAPTAAVEQLEASLARDHSARSATTEIRDATDPARQLATAAANYRHSITVATETLIGPDRLAELTTQAEQAVPGISTAPAWDTLRAHLAGLDLAGRDPIGLLSAAAAARELDTARDPAAVLDWRLDPSGNHSLGTGPLPWLPAVPATLTDDPTFGAYLTHSTANVADLARQVTDEARTWTADTAPDWATPYLADPGLVADLALWRASINTDPADLRPAGEPQKRLTLRGHRAELLRRALRVSGASDTDAAHRWATLATQLDSRILTDDGWPVLAGRLNTADALGVDIEALLRRAAAAGPLPAERPADALWWRLAPLLDPTGTDLPTGSTRARPPWTERLTTELGSSLSERVSADRLWPAIVARIDHAARHGDDPAQLIGTAAGLLRSHLDALRPSEVATGLLWSIGLVTDPPPAPDAALPPDPELADLQPPADADTILPDLHAHTPQLDTPQLDTAPVASQQSAAPRPAPADPRPLLAVIRDAHEFFQRHAPGSWTTAYLADRGLAGLSVGCAPAGWTSLTTYLLGLGHPEQALIDAGVARRSERTGRLYDLYRDRLILPIHGPDGQPVSFLGRARPGSDQETDRKYINGPTTALYRKSENPYGLTPDTIRRLRAGAGLIIAEGPLDVEALTRAARHADLDLVAVAPLGTALTADQLRTLDNIAPLSARQLLMATDNDPAGTAAAIKAHELLAAWRVDDADTLVLPPGCDPAQLLADSGPGDLAAALAHPGRLLDLVLDRLITANRPADYDALPSGDRSFHQREVLARLAELITSRPNGLPRLPEDITRQLSRIHALLPDLDPATITDAINYARYGETARYWNLAQQAEHHEPLELAHEPETVRRSNPLEHKAIPAPHPDPSIGDLSTQLEKARADYAAELAAHAAGNTQQARTAAHHLQALEDRAAELAPLLQHARAAERALADTTAALTKAETHQTAINSSSPSDALLEIQRLRQQIERDTATAADAAAALAAAAGGQPIITNHEVDEARIDAAHAAEEALAVYATRIASLQDALAAAVANTPTDDPGTDRGDTPETRWAHLARLIDTGLTSDPQWRQLADAIQRAHTAGYDVDTELPRLADAEPLPTHAAAAELTYRLYNACPDSIADLDIATASAALSYNDAGSDEGERRRGIEHADKPILGMSR